MSIVNMTKAAVRQEIVDNPDKVLCWETGNVVLIDTLSEDQIYAIDDDFVLHKMTAVKMPTKPTVTG